MSLEPPSQPPDERRSDSYRYELPQELIAQHPAERRDESRLLVLDGDRIDHARFRDLPEYLRANDVLVLNETRVIAARLFGTRESSGGRVELLLLHPASSARYDATAVRWIALARPARRLRVGEGVRFEPSGRAVVVAELDDGAREVAFDLDEPFAQFLERAGRLPLPPYVHEDSAGNRERYQTVFARVPGSVAAPTASLHFTPELLTQIEALGVSLARIVLDVGLGTFRPMTAERIDGHRMHAETYEVPAAAAGAIAAARNRGGRIIAAGTTVVRALESAAGEDGSVATGEGSTSLFITPGYRFRIVDALITNFHLPRSSLLVLVSAFAGRDRILGAYARAVRERYRFFSFGDAMFVVREGST
ncbi:MAG TPA: tRNA preQ1(34) S-adenosylmethionine ribosyltransferase-isomerase QueA [Candidatus Tumulicola sp.]